MVEKIQRGLVGYILGILSIVMAFFNPGAGIVLGVIGIIQSKEEKSEIAKKAKKLSTIGLVLSIIALIVSLIVTYLYAKNIIQNFPAI